MNTQTIQESLIDQLKKHGQILKECLDNAREAQSSALIQGHHYGGLLAQASQVFTQSEFDCILTDAGLSRPQAQKLIKLNKTVSIKQLQDANTTALRQGFLALEMLPAKEHIIHDGDGPMGSVVTPFDKCIANWTQLINKHRAGLLDIDIDTARNESLELTQWLCELHGIPFKPIK